MITGSLPPNDRLSLSHLVHVSIHCTRTHLKETAVTEIHYIKDKACLNIFTHVDEPEKLDKKYYLVKKLKSRGTMVTFHEVGDVGEGKHNKRQIDLSIAARRYQLLTTYRNLPIINYVTFHHGKAAPYNCC